MKNGFSKILKAGALAGTLDILAAFAQYFIRTGKNPLAVLKFIASGILGKEAFAGGYKVSLLGLILHYLIAYAFTFFFFWLFSKVPLFSKSNILTGTIYGIFIWLVMNLIVVPLSKVTRQPFTITGMLLSMLILIGCIGLPLFLMAASYFKTKSSKV